MDGTEQPRQVLVKCVLVGDNAVGKTRLICARACNQKVSLSQLLTTHVPTVWAIDQYRIYKEVLENSWLTVDGVDVSLRLWDTFGDHHKDRRFAYGRSDVVLMCFDIGRAQSLENCRTMWYQQIRKFCPQTPIILVGCKNDTRFIYKDDQYLRYCKERSPLVRQVHERDLVMPDVGRAAAKEMGLPYFETSVLTFFGVNEVFENAIRAALCARRTQRFWMTSLKRVIRPKIQEPFCPPRPALPRPSTFPPSTFAQDLDALFNESSMTDCILSCGSVGFSAHTFLLVSVSPVLRRLLSPSVQPPTCSITRSTSHSSLVSSSYGSSLALVGTSDETEPLLTRLHDSDELDSSILKRLPVTPRQRCSKRSSISPKLRRNSYSGSSTEDGLSKFATEPPLISSHPAFQGIQQQHCSSLDTDGRVVSSLQTVLTCSHLMPPQAVSHALEFIYTGRLNKRAGLHLASLEQVAKLLELPILVEYLNNLRNKEEFLNADLTTKMIETIGRQLEDVVLGQRLFSDIEFALDDGVVSAHKPLLMARCDMMQAMFSDSFLESSARCVRFPGVTCATFTSLLHFLYTDTAPPLSPTAAMPVLELANRLVLPRLVTLVEVAIIEQLTKVVEQGGDVCEQAISLLQPCQIHNAEQLADWCLAYLAQSYSTVCRRFPKVVRSLYPDNQAALNIHRWPPLWYLRDFELYQRMESDQKRNERYKPLKRSRYSSSSNSNRNDQSGCLCFTSKARKGSAS